MDGSHRAHTAAEKRPNLSPSQDHSVEGVVDRWHGGWYGGWYGGRYGQRQAQAKTTVGSPVVGRDPERRDGLHVDTSRFEDVISDMVTSENKNKTSKVKRERERSANGQTRRGLL